MNRVQVMAAAVVLAAGMPLSASVAQVAGAPAPAAGKGGVMDRCTADVLVRLALMDLRAIEDPKLRDYGVAEDLLGLAEGIDPANDDIIRRRAEAAWNAGDDDQLLESTRRLVDLDPKDTVVTLRLITGRISRLQTAQERLTNYEMLLGPKGQVLDPSIRSRLALDAALLMRELGEDAKFVMYLKQATQLDVTNKEAALVALDYYTNQTDNPTGRLELLSNLLIADPMDARVLIEVRDLLASGGAYKAAVRFHNIAAKILRASGGGDEAQLDFDSLIFQWRLDGPRPALESLVQQLEGARRQAQRVQDENTQGGLTYSQRSEDVRLGLQFEEARLGSALVLGNQSEVGLSIADLRKTVVSQLEVLKDRSRRPADMGDDEALDQSHRLNSRLVCWETLVRTLAPGGLAAAATAADMTVEPQTTPAPATADPAAQATAEDPVLAGWRAIGAGDFKAAMTAFDVAANQNDVWVLAGRAVVAEKSGNDEQAAKAYHALAAAAPITVLGTIASAREAEFITKLGGVRPGSATDPAALEAFAKSIPAWIDAMVERPWNFESIRVEPLSVRASVLDRVMVKVRVRNLSPVPLALGSGKPINTRLLFNPAMEVGGRVRTPDAEVLDVNHRLRLMPNEEFECVLWPEAGMVGYTAQVASEFPSRVSWRVLQGFEAATDQARSAGPGCIELHTDTVLHEALPESRLPADELADKIRQAGEEQFPAALVAAMAMINKDDMDSTGRIVDAIVQRYPSLSPYGRMLVAGSLPPSAKVPSLGALDERIAKDKDPSVLLVAVVARTKAADDPIMTAASAIPDPRLAGIVSAQRERFAEHVQTYSLKGPPDKMKAAAPGTPSTGASSGPSQGTPTPKKP